MGGLTASATLTHVAFAHTDLVSSRFRTILLLLVPLPALMLGVFITRRSGVSSNIVGQQLAVGLILTIACAIVCLRPRRSLSVISPGSIIIAASASVVLLVLTLLHQGVDGVRRWITLGPVQLHAGFVALPILIIVAGIVGRSRSPRARAIADACIVLTAVTLAFQPDASQAIAFAAAILIVVLQRSAASRIDWITVVVCIVTSVVAALRRDPLEPVPHVEGIVHLAASIGLTWLVASIVALMLLPIPFVLSWLKNRDHHEGIALAVYFVAVCIASLVAPFPVPVLGFGLSALLGYFMALGWTVRTDAVSTLARAGDD